MYWRTLPWDHSPGGLLAEEAGLRVARPDGSTYLPGDGKSGLLAATPELWDRVAAEIQAADSRLAWPHAYCCWNDQRRPC